MDPAVGVILAPYVPTPVEVVDRILDLANVSSDDVVYDLGCGDGRVVIEAARRIGARGVGIDVEPYWIDESRRHADAAGVSDLATFTCADATRVDLRLATVIYMYLVEWSVRMLAPAIVRTARPETRVVTLSFPVEGWQPQDVEELTDASGCTRRLFLYEPYGHAPRDGSTR